MTSAAPGAHDMEAPRAYDFKNLHYKAPALALLVEFLGSASRVRLQDPPLQGRGRGPDPALAEVSDRGRLHLPRADRGDPQEDGGAPLADLRGGHLLRAVPAAQIGRAS